jgi:phospholipid/cholesterol/gamma-HCH transport system substrate-binding protein
MEGTGMKNEKKPKLSHEKKVGLFFIITILLTMTMIFLFGKIRPFRRGYHIIVTFNHVSGLKVGDEVRLAGLRVGEVSSLETSQNKILVKLWIQERTKIKDDSRITISQISIMGGKYVSISPGSPKLPVILKGATVVGTDPPRFEDVVTEIGETGSEIRASVIKLSESFSKTAEQTNQILEENREAVKRLINSLNETTESLNRILTKIEKGEGTVGKLINEEELYDEVLQAVKDLRQTTEEIKTTVKDIKPPLQAAIENIEIITDRLEKGEGTLGRMLKPRTTQRSFQNGNKGYIK